MCGASGGSVHFRKALVGLLVAAAITGCSSGSNESNPYCEHLSDVSTRLANAQQNLFRNGAGGAGSSAALARIVGELQSLQSDAPVGLRQALAHLIMAFQQAERALRAPSNESRQQLTDAAHVLSVDGKKVTDYVVSKCK